MDGSSPSGFTDTPVGTGVGQFAAGTAYTSMATNAYPVVAPFV
tara:strand:+ start:1829 stop:1957 length:129 start_codon:yes stop_codon:yes gene_type:complete